MDAPNFTNPPAGADPLLGQTIGNYLVTQKLGEGGMGAVYLAEHPQIGKRVALKVLHAEFANNQDIVTRFFNEARAVNDIQHPNIVDVIDYGIIADGPRGDSLVYFIMEFLSGLTLTQTLKEDGPFLPERAFTIAVQIADALAASHRCGVVHRDLKPDNVMLSQRGRDQDFVKLLDFGIAKLTGDQPGSRKTRTGIVMGTPWYMSPEQCDGRGFVDHRTDIYALGVVLYEMITGRLPFLGEGYGEVLVQHLTQMPPMPSTLRAMSPYVEQIIMKALQKSQDARYPSMDEFVRALVDPVNYIEANGGLDGFLETQLASQGPMPPTVRLTPSPLTPTPGSLSSVRSLPTPTTLGGAAGQVSSSAPRRGLPFPLILGGLVLAAGVAVVAVLLVNSQKSHSTTNAAGSADGSGSNVAVVTNDGGTAVITPLGVGLDARPIDAAQVVIVDAAPIDAALKTTVTFHVTSDPVGASVTLDGKTRGETPLDIEIPKGGKVNLVVESRGYSRTKEQIDTSSDITRNYTLTKRGGSSNSGSNSGTKPDTKPVPRPRDDLMAP